MSSPSQPIPLDPKYILDLMVKRRWILAIPFFFAMIVGIVLAVKLPKIYTASTLILIHPQRVPQGYVQPIVSTGASDEFLASELQTAKARLEKVEAELRRYRETHMGELPEQLLSNLLILDRMQNHLEEALQQLSVAKTRLSDLERQALSSEGKLGAAWQNAMGLEPMLSLLSTYTDRYSDVVRLKAGIEEVKKKNTHHPDIIGRPGDPHKFASLPFQYRIHRAQILREIKRIETDIVYTQEQIERYEKRVKNAPKREEELISLIRDYEIAQNDYRRLYRRRIHIDESCVLKAPVKPKLLGSSPVG